MYVYMKKEVRVLMKLPFTTKQKLVSLFYEKGKLPLANVKKNTFFLLSFDQL